MIHIIDWTHFTDADRNVESITQKKKNTNQYLLIDAYLIHILFQFLL